MSVRSRQPKQARKSQEETAANFNPLKVTPILADDIQASLEAIDNEGSEPEINQRASRHKIDKKPWSKKKKSIIVSIASILLLLALLLGYVGVRLVISSGKMFDGNLLQALLSRQELQRDEYGRSNVLIFGTSEDHPGHSGAQLADSIIVLSVNQDTKTAATISIPRDLWVSYDQPCPVGYQGKINATYLCALSASGNDETAASLMFAKKVGDVTGLDIQYYAKVNYAFVRQSVDALGGVDITIDSRDSRGIYDVNTDLRLPNGTSTINGEQAIRLSRARGSGGGYGLEQSNFDREQNQQAVLRAIQQKAVSGGTLANPFGALGLIDSLSGNIKTNVESAELWSVIKVAAGIQPDNIISLPLNSAERSLVTTGSLNGQSIVRPVRGLMDYSGIQSYIQESFATPAAS